MSTFKVGNKIRCIDATCSGGDLELGKIYTVSVARRHHIELCGVGGGGWFPERFELVEPAGGLNLLRDLCFSRASEAGWHDKPREVGTMLMLIVSEVAEAMEGYRKGLMDDHLPERSMIEVELADAVIRICDLAGKLDLDLDGAVSDKLEYNLHREDHKREVRESEGGKSF